MSTLPQEVKDRLAQDFNTEAADPPRASSLQIAGSHYKDLAIQPAYFSEMNKLSILEGSVVKRVCRHRTDKGAQDIRRAIRELQLILEFTYGEAP